MFLIHFDPLGKLLRQPNWQPKISQSNFCLFEQRVLKGIASFMTNCWWDVIYSYYAVHANGSVLGLKHETKQINLCLVMWLVKPDTQDVITQGLFFNISERGGGVPNIKIKWNKILTFNPVRCEGGVFWTQIAGPPILTPFGSKLKVYTLWLFLTIPIDHFRTMQHIC